VLGKQPTRVSVLPATLARLRLAYKLMKNYDRNWSLDFTPCTSFPNGCGAPKHAQFNYVKVAKKFLQIDSNIYKK
jgi:hypothetical protein